VRRTKVIALLEAREVTGPAKNLLRFAADCRDFVDLTFVTFIRSSVQNLDVASNNQFISEARSLGVPVETVRETGPFDLSVLGLLRRIFERHNADIVQTHGIKSHFLVSLLPRRRFRWIAFHHGYTNENMKAVFYHQFDRWSLRSCDLVVTVCSNFAKLLTRRGVCRARIVVVPNSVNINVSGSDPESSKKIKQRWDIAYDESVVLSIGRLSREKGHRYLIEAVSRIVQASPQVRFQVLITGDGPAVMELKAQVHKGGLDERIKFTGYCADTKGLYSIADLFVLPSLSEGSPNVLLESMAARVPIVATNVGGVPEILDDGVSAVLVPPANSELMAAAIVELLINGSHATALASIALEKVSRVYNTTRYDQSLLNIYNRLLGERSL
jgi:glycosyltransferase involved in cell wall biosynthesis